MPKITFIRHQQQKNHSLDPDIIHTSEIPNYDYDIIICSPYLRCRQTALLFYKGNNIYVDVNLSDYHENKKEGNFNTSTLEYHNIPIVENWEEFVIRIDYFCKKIKSLTCDALVITHGIVIKYLEEKLLGTNNYKQLGYVPFMHGFIFVF